MPWNTLWPDGAKSVKANGVTGRENTTYITNTMGSSPVGTNTTSTRDHFWNVGANEDGRHRFIQSPAFTSTAAAPDDVDPVIGAGMDGVMYLREVNPTIGRVEGFYRNINGIYQFIPSYLTGTHNITSAFSDMVAVPANTYGEIFIFRDSASDPQHAGQAGFFRSNATVCQAWSYALGINNGTDTNSIRLGNGVNASGLNIRVRTTDAASGNDWKYYVTYRAR
jgi:hypothetical protein